MVKDFQTYTFISVNTRIATKLGTGEFKNRFVQDNYTQTAGNKDYIQKLNAIEHSREAYVKGHNTPPGVPTQKGLTGDVEFISEAYPVVEFGNYDIPEGWENALAKPTQTGVPAQWENPNTTGFESSSEEETNLYFFHSDHLGSTNYLTDKDGVVQQSLVYMPYGEILSETKTYSNPYKFNGKELDTETGLAYYGARYYSPELSVWYGCDPVSESKPNISAYTFCRSNPIVYIDPDGRDEYECSQKGKITWVKESNTDSFHFVNDKGERTGESLSFDKKVVEKMFSMKSSDNIKVNYLKVKGDNNATKIFKFLADNSISEKTEYGLTRVGDKSGDEGVNLIGSNDIHKRSATSANKAVFDNGYTIREANHNHPSGNSNPSDGDLNVLNMIQGQFSNAKFNIYANKKIKPYTKNSKDFEGEMLNEIIITPRLK